MPFRSPEQRSHACYTLLTVLSHVFADEHWAPGRGPTEVGFRRLHEHLNGERVGLSRGEVLMLIAAFDFWNGGGHVHVHELIEHLEPRLLNAIGELLSAVVQGDAVDRWIAKWAASPVPLVS